MAQLFSLSGQTLVDGNGGLWQHLARSLLGVWSRCGLAKKNIRANTGCATKKK